MLLLRRPTNITVYILILHFILLELPNLNGHILSHWGTFMYVAVYFILYFILFFWNPAVRLQNTINQCDDDAPAVDCPRCLYVLILIDCQTDKYTRRASAHSLTLYTQPSTDITRQKTKTIGHSNSLLWYSDLVFWDSADSGIRWFWIPADPNIEKSAGCWCCQIMN